MKQCAEGTQNRYRELMRVSRQWRNLQAMKRAGLAHDLDRTRTPGDLALFCATCPQPGINLPFHEAEQAQNKCVTLHARGRQNFLTFANIQITLCEIYCC